MTAHLAFCIDNQFAPHLGVLLSSIQHTNSGGGCHFHVLGDGLSRHNCALLRTQVASPHTLTLYEVNDPQIKQLPVSQAFADRLDGITYYRLLLPTVLPLSINNVLFLDADTILRGNIQPILDIDLGEHLAAVVEDISRSNQDHTKAIGMSSQKYFNAGMMLINLSGWRDLEISQKCLALLSGGQHWPCNDQDVLNIILEGHCKYLAPKWNWQLIKPQLVDDEPIIVHYNGAEKPWHHSCIMPFTEDYRHFKQQSVFHSFPLEFGLDEHDLQLISQLRQLNIHELIIYGAGIKGRRLAAYITTKFPDIAILALIDRYPVFSHFLKIPVFSEIENVSETAVLVASKAFANEISASLSKKNTGPVIAVSGE